MNKKYRLMVLALAILSSACTVGPDYKRPQVAVPNQYKEEKKDWQLAKPQQVALKSDWWQSFHDPVLNNLELKLNNANQNIAEASAQFLQARALVDEARSAYFPTVTGSALLARQTASSTSQSNHSSSNATPKPNNSHSWLLDASWEPDIWGTTRRTVEANEASAKASSAQLAATRLSQQASLAQYYFELRGIDSDQRLLDDIVSRNQKILTITEHQYQAGTAAEADILQAKSALQSAQALAINNGITRAQYEHALAVLVGEPPAALSITVNKPLTPKIPTIPGNVPSTLLERRPDIAAAEQLMAEANAEVGVATAAYFPTVTLSATASGANSSLAHWFSLPMMGWSLGQQVAGTIVDGGLRSATVSAAKANYAATVASYRQTVLAAFQDVEDNLVSLRLLAEQAAIQDQAAADAKRALDLMINQYQAGTVVYSSVLTAQITADSAEKTALDTHYLQMTAAVGLIKALGGGFTAS